MADLDSRSSVMRQISFRLAWALYLVAVFTIGFGRTIEKIVRDSGGFWSRYGPALGAFVAALGVAGWLIGKPIGWRVLWAAIFGLSVLAAVGMLALEELLVTGWDAPLRIHGLVLAGVLLLVPTQWALWRYSFRSPQVWAHAASSTLES